MSACLLGLPTRYDGGACPQTTIIRLVWAGPVIAICPELMGGLATPRPPAQITGGDGRDVLAGHARVVRETGEDVTAAFLEGVHIVGALAQRSGAKCAFLKDGSPACGATHIKRGRETVAGLGVCAALLSQMGVEIRPV